MNVNISDDFTLDLMDEEGRALSIYSRKGSVMGSECLTVSYVNRSQRINGSSKLFCHFISLGCEYSRLFLL